MIIVNDGSTDKTSKIINEYIKKHSNIQLINRKNKGPLVARVNGIKQVDTEYVYIVDGDDLIEETLIEKIINIINKTDGDLIMFDYNYYINGEKNGKYEHLYGSEKELTKISKEKLLKDLLSYGNFNQLWTKVFKKNVFDKIEYDYNKHIGLRKSSDLFQVISIILNSNEIWFYNKKLYNYNINESSISSKNSSHYLGDLLQTYIHIKESIETNHTNLNKYFYSKILTKFLYYYVSLNIEEKLKRSEKKELLNKIKNSKLLLGAKEYKKNYGFREKIALKLFNSKNTYLFDTIITLYRLKLFFKNVVEG